jgi:lysozyme family protein
MIGNFDNCMDNHLKRHEGGYVNNPKDPGGETNFGISKRSYPRVNIKTLTWAGAKEIYRRDFWDAIQGDRLPLGIDLVTLDPAINSGPKQGIKFLQAGLGVTPDGVYGPKTFAALLASNPIKVIQGASRARLSFMRSLRTWSTFGKGWSRRVAEIEVEAIKMAGMPPVLIAKQSTKLATQATYSTIFAGSMAMVAGAAVATAPTGLDHWAVALPAIILALRSIVERLHQLNLAAEYAKEADNA